MPIQLRRKTTTGAGAAVLASGELAVNTVDKKLYLGNGVANTELLGGPVGAGTASHDTLRWDGTAWVKSANFQITTLGAQIPATKELLFLDTAILSLGTGSDFTMMFDGNDLLGEIADTADFYISDSTGDRLKLDTSGNLTFRGTSIYTGASATIFNNGFQRIRVLDQSTYDGLGGGLDANTIYLITA